jgi:CDP-diacylglycerol--glycerol-3-phosphate 3-phosphatidyltransferase
MPRITANQVTIGRLLAMPLMAALIYGDERVRVFGVILGTLVGLTDFVDGRLARKYGVTVVGSLLDPVADKVFIIVCYAPYADRGGIPWWIAAAIISRELLVTVLRSSVELAGRRLPSSTMAKTKTWAQMIGFGVLVLIPILGEGRGLRLLFSIPLAVALVAALGGRLALGATWRPMWFAAAAFGALLAASAWRGPELAQTVLLVIIVGITWVSAADYLGVGLRELARVKAHRAMHVLRLAGGGLLPVVALAALGTGHAPTVPIIVLLSCDTARGALDNFVAHMGVADFSWAASLWVEIGLLAIALASPPGVASLGLAVAAALTGGVETLRTLLKYTRHARQQRQTLAR